MVKNKLKYRYENGKKINKNEIENSDNLRNTQAVRIVYESLT